MANLFQHTAVADENSLPRSRADCRRDRERRRESERTRARDHQNRYCPHQRFVNGRPAKTVTNRKSANRHKNNARNKDFRNFINRSFEIRARADGAFDQTDNLRKCRVLPDPGGAHLNDISDI